MRTMPATGRVGSHVNDERLVRAQRRMRDLGIGSLLVGPSPDLRWLVGYEALPLERLTLLVVPADGSPVLVVPELERPRAVDSGAGDLVEVLAGELVEQRHVGRHLVPLDREPPPPLAVEPLEGAVLQLERHEQRVGHACSRIRAGCSHSWAT